MGISIRAATIAMTMGVLDMLTVLPVDQIEELDSDSDAEISSDHGAATNDVEEAEIEETSAVV
ncbi:hypothetical protein GQ600_20178 [Phytophthora cactorum]|nr:hypothetical protein GQ600_20178 [Phytophthora cactorum]